MAAELISFMVFVKRIEICNQLLPLILDQIKAGLHEALYTLVEYSRIKSCKFIINFLVKLSFDMLMCVTVYFYIMGYFVDMLWTELNSNVNILIIIIYLLNILIQL